MTKIVSQLDEAGYFIGSVIADPSPLEDGVWLIPRLAIDVEPPAVVAGQRARWDGVAFVIEDQAESPVPVVAEVLSLDGQVGLLGLAIQQHLDQTAIALGYDSIYTAVTYADEPAVPKYQAEGKALRQWRSLVWDAANKIRADVQAGKRPVPSAEQLIAELQPFQGPA